MRAVAKGVRRTTSRWGSRLEPFTHVDLQLAEGRNLDVITQAETIDPFSAALGADYERYTAGTVMLETADRLVAEERQPSVQQFLLLVGGLRAMTSAEHRPGQVLDSYLLRSLAVAGYAPSFDALRPLRRRGTAPLVQPVGRRRALRRLPGARLGRPGRRDGRRAGRAAGRRLAGRRRRPTRGTCEEASGLVAAYLALAPRARPALAGVRRAVAAPGAARARERRPARTQVVEGVVEARPARRAKSSRSAVDQSAEDRVEPAVRRRCARRLDGGLVAARRCRCEQTPPRRSLGSLAFARPGRRRSSGLHLPGDRRGVQAERLGEACRAAAGPRRASQAEDAVRRTGRSSTSPDDVVHVDRAGVRRSSSQQLLLDVVVVMAPPSRPARLQAVIEVGA